MNIRCFFQPTPDKIIAFTIMFWYAGAFIANPQLGTACSACGCYNTWGFPLPFYQDVVVGANFFDLTLPFSCGTVTAVRNYWYLALDAAVWLIASLGLIYVINLFKGNFSHKRKA